MPKEEMRKNLSVYILKQYASEASRRELQILRLREFFAKVVLIRQSSGNNFPYADASTLLVRKPPNITGILNLIQLDQFKRRLDQLYFPSPTILYVKAAQRQLQAEIKKDFGRNRKVCLITPVPPHDLLVAGLYLKRKYPQIHWIVDWQDLWSYDEFYFSQVPKFMQNKVKVLEKEVFNTCDANVVTNDFAKTVLEEHHGISPKRIWVISHAYDRNGTNYPQNSVPQFKDGPIQIGFLGNLFKPPKVPGEEVLAALQYVKQSGIDLVFHIVGDKYLEKVTRKPVENFDWAVVHDFTTHDNSLRLVSNCDFLLVALADLPNSRAILHIKLPFYFMLGKLILALVPENSAVAEAIRHTGTGYVIHNPRTWGKSLVELFRRYKSDGSPLKRNQEAVDHYSWSIVSKQWLEVICRPVNRTENAWH